MQADVSHDRAVGGLFGSLITLGVGKSTVVKTGVSVWSCAARWLLDYLHAVRIFTARLACG